MFVIRLLLVMIAASVLRATLKTRTDSVLRNLIALSKVAKKLVKGTAHVFRWAVSLDVTVRQGLHMTAWCSAAGAPTHSSRTHLTAILSESGFCNLLRLSVNTCHTICPGTYLKHSKACSPKQGSCNGRAATT